MTDSTRRSIVIRRVLVLVAIVVAALTAAAMLTQRHAKPAAPAQADRTLEFLATDLYTVKRGVFIRSVPVTGTLAPYSEATVKAKIAGELLEISVREGMAVKKGQVLARIDPTEALARLAARDADVAATRAQLDLTEKNRNTQQALVDRNFISRNAFDATQNAYDVAMARLRSAEAERDLARKALADAVLLAPINGFVALRLAEPGERVAVDARLVTIVDLSRLELEVSLPAAVIGEIRPGQKLGIQVDGIAGRTYSGVVERINPATNAGSRSISVYALIDNAGASLRSGMFAQGSIELQRVENSVVIPASSLRSDAGRNYVYVIDAATLKRVEITISRDDATGEVRVLSGLEAGSVIVRNNLGPLRDGASVRILESGRG